MTRLTAGKAKEMLANPPHGKKLTGSQTRYFQAVAHGWTPTRLTGRKR